MEALKKNILDRWNAQFKGFFRFEITPRRQFKRLMVATFVVGVVLLGFHAYLFYLVETHGVFETIKTAPTPATVVSEKKLTMVLERFENKALIRATAVQLSPVVKDPSQ
jgi:hypothetical protein